MVGRKGYDYDRTAETDRRSQRSRALRAHGSIVSPVELAAIAQSPRRFAAELRALGVNPDIYGSLAVAQRGGPPSSGTPEAAARSQRYHYLRACGLPSLECTPSAGSVGPFVHRLRQLAARRGAESLPPLPPELDYPGIPPEVPRLPVPTEKIEP